MISTQDLVLLVENEPFVREAIEDILCTVGLGVISTSNGYEGLNKYRLFQDKIGLVILDMKLPGMDGVEILQKLRLINPAVKVLIASGYEEGEVNKRLQDQQQTASFLKKPYNADALLTAVKNILI